MAANERRAMVSRKTQETDITVSIELDGSGKNDITTEIGFFDHMLDGFARHGMFNLDVQAKGDLFVDCHHTIEDVGIVLGGAIRNALGDKVGIRRFGECILPMDEALVLCAIDLSGRPYFRFEHKFEVERVGYFDTEMVQEFFYAISYSAGMNLHFMVMRDGNAHHVIEAMFKAFGKALDMAATEDPRIQSVLSTKGSL
ncbi:MAG: imidazoleglycerol-phosphate dehydratase HisB [Lachnospiraceae bacterium]|nr:imidazoleglycerol-phosphate dehydratase HisB [Lachnospiraceae bacterium]